MSDTSFPPRQPLNVSTAAVTIPIVLAVGVMAGIATQSFVFGAWKARVDTTFLVLDQEAAKRAIVMAADHDTLVDMAARTRRMEQDIAELKDMIRAKR